MADMYFNTKDRDWGDFYNSLGRTDLSPNLSSVPSGDLTTRSVRTVAIDPYTGQPKVAATPSFQQGMMGRGITSVGSPNLTAAEQQLLSQQIQQSQALQAGYNPDGTPKPLPIRPSWSIPTPVSRPNASPIDQAAYNATKKPGTWLAQSRMHAQALMRQMAALQGGMSMVPAAVPVAPATGGLAALITGKGTPRAKSNGGLAAVLAAPPNPYQTPEYRQSQGYKDAYKSSSGNVGGVSQHGRFYDIDRNQWVDTTKKSNSPSGERTYAMGAS